MKNVQYYFLLSFLWSSAIALLSLAATPNGAQHWLVISGGVCLMAALEVTKSWIKQP